MESPQRSGRGGLPEGDLRGLLGQLPHLQEQVLRIRYAWMGNPMT